MYYKDDLVSIVKQKYVNASGGFESGTFLLNWMYLFWLAPQVCPT